MIKDHLHTAIHRSDIAKVDVQQVQAVLLQLSSNLCESNEISAAQAITIGTSSKNLKSLFCRFCGHLTNARDRDGA